MLEKLPNTNITVPMIFPNFKGLGSVGLMDVGTPDKCGEMQSARYCIGTVAMGGGTMASSNFIGMCLPANCTAAELKAVIKKVLPAPPSPPSATGAFGGGSANHDVKVRRGGVAVNARGEVEREWGGGGKRRLSHVLPAVWGGVVSPVEDHVFLRIHALYQELVAEEDSSSFQKNVEKMSQVLEAGERLLNGTQALLPNGGRFAPTISGGLVHRRGPGFAQNTKSPTVDAGFQIQADLTCDLVRPVSLEMSKTAQGIVKFLAWGGQAVEYPNDKRFTSGFWMTLLVLGVFFLLLVAGTMMEIFTAPGRRPDKINDTSSGAPAPAKSCP